MNDIKKTKPLIKSSVSHKFPSGFFTAVEKAAEGSSPRPISNPDTKTLTKVLKHLDRMPEHSSEKLFYPNLEFSSTVSSISRKTVEIEDLVSVSSTLKDKNLTCKKVIDSRTLDLYSVQQYSIGSQRSSKKMQESLENWRNLSHPSIIQVVNTYWNVPETFLTIVCQYFPGSSLDSLVSILGSVPESILNSVALKLLKIAKWAEENGKKIRSFELSQVFCTRDGDVKLIPNLNQDLEAFLENPRVLIAKVLIQAVFLDELRPGQPSCCFFHSLKEDVMMKRMSKPFQHFLCRLTCKRSQSFDDLISHPWFGKQDFAGPDLRIQDVLKIFPFREESSKVDRICENLKIVVGRQKTSRPGTAAVHSLADDLGVGRKVLEKKIHEIFDEE